MNYYRNQKPKNLLLLQFSMDETNKNYDNMTILKLTDDDDEI